MASIKKSKAKKNARKKSGSTFKKIAGAYSYKPKLSQTLMGFANANRSIQSAAGRPKKVYKHTSPLSGKPVPAETYYSHMRQFKNIEARRVEDAKEQQIREYAKRGVPPSQIAQAQERARQKRLLDQIQQRQVQSQPQQFQNQQRQAEQLPEGTVIHQGTRVWKHRRGVVTDDWSAFGRKKVVRGLPSSFFN